VTGHERCCPGEDRCSGLASAAIKRVREPRPDLLGDNGWRWRVLRTSNSYAFNDPSPAGAKPNSSKSEKETGTPNQEFFSPMRASREGLVDNGLISQDVFLA
jgi:hypothetical protein